MTSTQRVIVSILAGVAYAIIMGMAGGNPNGAQIALVISITAMITRKFRKERNEDDDQ